MNHVVLRDALQVFYYFVCLWVLVALQEVQDEVHPEEAFDHLVNYYYNMIINRRKGSIEHRHNARVADEQQDEHVKYGLPFAVCADDDSLLYRHLLVLYFFLIDFILAQEAIVIVYGGGLENARQTARSVQHLSLSFLLVFVDITLPLLLIKLLFICIVVACIRLSGAGLLGATLIEAVVVTSLQDAPLC